MKKLRKSIVLIIILLLCIVELLTLTGCSNENNENGEKDVSQVFENTEKNQEPFNVGEYLMKYGVYEYEDKLSAVIVEKDKFTILDYETGEAREYNFKIEVSDFGLEHATNNTPREAFVLCNKDGQIVNAFYPIVDYKLYSYGGESHYIFNDKITLEELRKQIEENGVKIHLVEDKKVEEEKEEDSAIVNNTSGKGLQIGDYFVTYGIYEFKKEENRATMENGKIVSKKVTIISTLEIYTNKIIIKSTENNSEDEYTYKIEEYNYSSSPNIDPNIHTGIVVYEGPNEHGGVYPIANNKLTANKNNDEIFVLKKAFTDEELNNSVNIEIAKTHIVLKDYKLHNGLYVTLPSIKTLAISSTSGKYRINNEVGTFSINGNEITLENGMLLTVIEDNKFTCNGKTFTLDKEY